MSLDPKQVAAELEEVKKRQLIAKTLHLSKCKYWIMLLLLLLSPIAAYLYTRRWKAMFFVFMSTCFMAFLYVGEEDDFEEAFRKGTDLAPVAALVAGIDNWLGIRRAKQKVALWNQDSSGSS